MVAKSYQSLEQLSDIYAINSKKYVKVRLKSGAEKQVRWYSDIEYAKLYPEDKVTAAAPINDPYYRPQKDVLGFENGYITIFKGDTYNNLEWFQASPARYTRYWGWYFGSNQEIPADLPSDVEPMRLDWALVGNDETGRLIPEDQIKPIVEGLMFDEQPGEWVGSVGERLDLVLTVKRALDLESQYGRSTLHTMSDEAGNIYIWSTAAKHWEVGSVRHIRGTVKDHSIFRGQKQTVLTRCAEVK